MIHRIEIENFYSVREKQVLDLRIPKTTPDDRRFPQSWSDPEVRLPTVIAFYGANASGKTTVLRALTSTIQFAVDSFDWQTDGPVLWFEPFRSEEAVKAPTRIAIEFEAGWIGGEPRLYRYELTLANVGPGMPMTVESEILRHRPDRKFVKLLERRETTILVDRLFGTRPRDSLRTVRANASVISALAKNGNPMATTIRADIGGTKSNFAGFEPFTVDRRRFLDALGRMPAYLERLNHDLRRMDLGIEGMEIRAGYDGPVALFRHKGLGYDVIYDAESNGTRKFIENWARFHVGLEEGRTVIVDEIDTMLHPLLLPEIVRWFHDTRPDKYGNPGQNAHRAQLFVNVHNPALMMELEKEELFFTAKDETGATEIYGARDIRGLRRDPSLWRKYLGGVFGAVPQIG
jgi:hypothetical protein